VSLPDFTRTGDLPPGVHTASLAETVSRFRLAAIGGEEAAIQDWQIKRDGTERGIVEVKVE